MRQVLALIDDLIGLNTAQAAASEVAEIWAQVTRTNDMLHIAEPPPVRRGKKARRIAAVAAPARRWYGQCFYEQTLHASIHQIATEHTGAQLTRLRAALVVCLTDPLQ
jgi:hypothetical protein